MKKYVKTVLPTLALLPAVLFYGFVGKISEKEVLTVPVFAVENAFGEREEIEISSRFWELLFGKKERSKPQESAETDGVQKLLPGGDVLGVVIRGCGVTVVDVKDESSPLKKGDKVLSVDGFSVTECAQVQKCIAESNGKPISFHILRGEKELVAEVVPTLSEGEYRAGLSLSDTAAGIGTLTYVDPKSGDFGCLGHAIAGADSDAPLPMSKGLTTEALLGGVKRGTAGSPGELRGVLTEEVIGRILANTDCGVFGDFTDREREEYSDRQAVEILPKSDVAEGQAVIRSTLKNGMLEECEVELYEIDRASEGTKSFRVRVTDPALIAITGGIVRGMSGSPILQDGKLVGAVTHVTVGDPTEGYGIFIENMLNAASKPNTEGQSAA